MPGSAHSSLVPQPPRDIAWQERPLLTIKATSQILGLSTASIYHLANKGQLRLKRLGGRTLVPTAQVVALVAGLEDWAPSDRTHRANEARRTRHAVREVAL